MTVLIDAGRWPVTLGGALVLAAIRGFTRLGLAGGVVGRVRGWPPGGGCPAAPVAALVLTGRGG